MSKIKVFINNIEVNVKSNSTLMEACESIGIKIPRFCYHERLSVAGNCRMCLVEVEKSPKPVVSCAMPVMNGMKIFTKSPLVKKAREAVMEFLLINHPLDCPICDQGGECDLQDQGTEFGSDKSRFYQYKRGVDDKNIGPLVKTIMTRCIHCTRCVRFATEIAGVEVLGTTLRGKDTEIGTYLEKIFTSELSGNVIDLCPVGALTSKPYAFNSRPWELRTGTSIDILDGIGSNLSIDFRGNDIIRIRPRLNEFVNEEWISDKARFFFDSLNSQRITNCLIKNENSFRQISFVQTVSVLIKEILKTRSRKISIIVDKDLHYGNLIVIKKIFRQLGCNNIGVLQGFNRSSIDIPSNFKFNVGLKGLENSDSFLILYSNLRNEAVSINSILRQIGLRKKIEVGLIGPSIDLSYKYNHLGINLNVLIKVLQGKHKFCQKINQSKKFSLLYSANFLERSDQRSLLKIIRNINSSLLLPIINLNFINHGSNETGIYNLGINKINLNQLKKSELIFVLGQNIPYGLKTFCKKSKIVAHNAYGNETLLNAFIVIPSTNFLETKGWFLNTEGKFQFGDKLFNGPKNSTGIRDQWMFFLLLKNFVLKKAKNIFTFSSLLKDTFVKYPNNSSFETDLHANQMKQLKVLRGPLVYKYNNFFLTHNLCKLSKTITTCIDFRRKLEKNF
jgi:NADH dehydrogenase (ubiquinone) Fe-S protein 1